MQRRNLSQRRRTALIGALAFTAGFLACESDTAGPGNTGQLVILIVPPSTPAGARPATSAQRSAVDSTTQVSDVDPTDEVPETLRAAARTATASPLGHLTRARVTILSGATAVDSLDLTPAADGSFEGQSRALEAGSYTVLVEGFENIGGTEFVAQFGRPLGCIVIHASATLRTPDLDYEGS